MGEPESTTTLPAASAGSDQAKHRDLVLLWVFPELGGRTTPLTGLPLVLGRDADGGARLVGREISRRHAELRRDGPLVVIRDLGSRNGVFVNGRRVDEAPLGEGDVVRVGDGVAVVAGAGPHDPDRPPPAPLFFSYGPGLFAGPVLGPTVRDAERVAHTDLPVVVCGETGTGKEGIARAIHAWSGRKGAFVAVNCAAIPDSLAEAELFGYRRGAFTGADRANAGYFRAAHEGTLLLDEITDLPLALQPKLLRVLEQREVTAIGEVTPTRIDVRIIAASQRPIRDVTAEGRFRSDLLARIDGMTIELPPLRERRVEIPHLFARIVAELGAGHAPALDARLIEALCLAAWPRNVRELYNVARQMLVTHGLEPVLRAAHLPKYVLAQAPRGEPNPHPTTTAALDDDAPAPMRDAHDLAALGRALRTSAGNVARAAARVGISRQRVYRLLRSTEGLDLDSIRREAAAAGRRRR